MAGQPRSTLSLATARLRAEPHILAEDLADEVVLLDLHHGIYYGLNSAAATVWHGVVRGHGVQEILDALQRIFDAEPDELERDVMALLRSMIAAGLVSAES